MNYERSVHSKLDNTVKHVFSTKEGPVEFSFIDKNDGKAIVCVPTQTSCRLGCKFCHLTGRKDPVRNLHEGEIIQGVEYALGNSTVRCWSPSTLLVSYMGSGEPLHNIEGVIELALMIRGIYQREYPTVRFAISTLLPRVGALELFGRMVKSYNLNFKVHLSLHSPFDTVRKEWMPAASGVVESVSTLGDYALRTGNEAEIHYTLIDGVNDRATDCNELIRVFAKAGYNMIRVGGHKITVKILKFSPKAGESYKESGTLRPSDLPSSTSVFQRNTTRRPERTSGRRADSF
jgi:23S rRNA (adenine2503-C2)-methyltransferase